MTTPSEAFAAEIAAANATDDAAPEGTEPAPVAAEPPATEPAAAAPAAVAQPDAPQGPRTASFDDLTPDVPDLPPTLRSVPWRIVIADRTEAIQKRDAMGNEKNAAIARAEVLEKALEVLTRRLGPEPTPQPAAEPPPPETSIGALKRRVDPESLQFDQEGVLGAVIDAADERSLNQVAEAEKKLRAEYDAKLAEIRGGLDEIKQERAAQRTFSAYRTAFPDRDPMTDPDLDDISFLIESINSAAAAKGEAPPLPVDDPASYRTAAARLDAIAARRAPAPVPPPPAPTTTAAPSAPAATPAPAPPVGSGAPLAAAPPANVEALPQHLHNAMQDVANIFPQLRGKKDIVDEIAGELAADVAAGKSPFSRHNVRRSATA